LLASASELPGLTSERDSYHKHMRDDLDCPRVFLEFSRRKLLQELWPRTCQCLEMLTDEQIWWRAQETSNSIGNLLLHLNGNVRQWLVTPLGGASSERNRSAEFAERQSIPRHDLRDRLDATLRNVDEILRQIDPAALSRTYDIQNQKDVTALEAIYHVVEHFSMHYGQILYITKFLTGHDLGFYRYLDEKR
jgi:uncharacterized damage-inducible protein DinB